MDYLDLIGSVNEYNEIQKMSNKKNYLTDAEMQEELENKEKENN